MDQSNISRTSGITAKDKFGYMFGDFASCLVLGLVNSVLQKYYTDVLRIGIVSILWMFVFARVWDAVNDPIWGRIVDRMPAHEDGRYRHWLKTLSIPTAIAAVLMFVKIPGLSDKGYIIYAYVTYILFGMLYTGINIPYGSMAQVITSDEKERSSLSVFRSVGSTFGAMPALALISLCYTKNADGVSEMDYWKVLIGAAVISILSVVIFRLCHKMTVERVKTEPAPKQKGQTLKVIGVLFKSRPFMAVCVAGMMLLAGQMFTQSYSSYLFHYYFNAPQLTFAPTVCQYLPVAIIMLFATKLGNKVGRSALCAYGMLAAGVCNLALFFMNTTNPYAYLLVCLISGIGNAFFFLLVWAIVTDAIDYNQVKYGINDDATSYAFFTFMRKLGQTIAAVLVNLALISIGYTDNVLNESKINGPVLKTMYTEAVLIPAVLFLIIFVALKFWYPLGKKEIAELQIEKEKLLAQNDEAAEEAVSKINEAKEEAVADIAEAVDTAAAERAEETEESLSEIAAEMIDAAGENEAGGYAPPEEDSGE